MKMRYIVLFILVGIFLDACTNKNLITGKQTSGTGSIHITGTPTDAFVLIDGSSNGQFGNDGEMTISGLSAGNHVIQVKKFNYCSIIRSKSVNAGQTTEMEANLAKKGKLSVQSTPSGADFAVDGVAGYKTPKLVDGLCAGNHILYFSKTGYKSKSENKYVNGGTTTQLSIQLVPA